MVIKYQELLPGLFYLNPSENNGFKNEAYLAEELFTKVKNSVLYF
jgi:hypothetical protein